jgi:hypothetical protein
MKYYDNTLTNYFTKLPQSIELEGKWEVALSEIQYPRTWRNIIGNEAYLVVSNTNENWTRSIILSAGLYDTPEKLIKCLNDLLEVSIEFGNIIFTYDDITHNITLYVEHYYTLLLGEKLVQILGLGQNSFSSGKYIGKNVVDIYQGFYSMYVYCNIVEQQIVGDSLVPLLRIIPVEGQHGYLVTKTYENPHYLPVQVKQFQTIEIDIRDDTGKPIPFERGKVVVSLHFRRQKIF